MKAKDGNCYFLNTSGQHLIHLCFYFALKLLLMLIVYVGCRKRVPDYQQRYEGIEERERE